MLKIIQHTKLKKMKRFFTAGLLWLFVMSACETLPESSTPLNQPEKPGLIAVEKPGSNEVFLPEEAIGAMRELERIHKQLTRDFFAANLQSPDDFDTRTISQAWYQKDESLQAAVFGMDIQAYKELGDEIMRLSGILSATDWPGREELLGEYTSLYCPDAAFESLLDHIQQGRINPPGGSPGESDTTIMDPDQPGGGSDGDNCHWARYSAALLLCASTGPIAYWVCAWGAYCTFCWGPIADRLCF